MFAPAMPMVGVGGSRRAPREDSRAPSGEFRGLRTPGVSGLLGTLLLTLPALPLAADGADAPSGSEPAGEIVSDAGSEGDGEDGPSTEPEATFLESLTVAATRSERPVADIPGKVDVIRAQEIEERGYTGLDDLVRYIPGVDLDGDLTRLGDNGFEIRGIGGNRVLTEVDGIPTAEQFDFGPFSVHRFALDIDALESVEIVRSAGSALYGSDALGGVVALTTRTPSSYLGGQSSFLGLRSGWDGRADEASLSGIAALGGDRWRGSLLYTHREGSELDNQGTVETRDSSRTTPDPIDRTQQNALFQLTFTPSSDISLRGVVEWLGSEAETDVLSNISGGSPFSSAVLDSRGVDTQDRLRLSLDQSGSRGTALFDTFLWRAFVQQVETEQLTFETRLPFQGLAEREGVLTFDQETSGAELELRKGLGSSGVLTYGISFQREDFDQLRDRSETFVTSGEPVPTTLAFPTKYFPESEVEELGVFAQGELELFGGRLTLVPGVRFDRYSLNADENDPVFLAGNPGTPTPVDLDEDSVSPKLGAVLALNDELSVFAQYARGFRAPPMSEVNNGFTNLAGGYRTLPNPDLEPETSDNFELGLRGSFARASFSITVFENSYDDFIDTVFLGFDPIVFLSQFQPQNVDDVTIEGFELAAELRLARGFRVRAAYSNTEATNETLDEPLDSITPPQGVIGLEYRADNGRWGSELILTATDSKGESDLPSGSTQFRAPSYEVIDLLVWLSITERLELQISGWNLSDETYWQWPYVRGQSRTSATIDRFTSPGRSFGAQLRFSF